LVNIKLPYGKTHVQFEVPSKRLLGIVKPRDVPATSDVYSMIVRALENPVKGQGLRNCAMPVEKVVIVTDDYTRPTPAGEICTPILDQLNAMGIEDSSVTILAAGGLHRPMTEEELEAKFGKEIFGRVRIVSHNAWDEDQLNT
jgi:nickel-dependent lactate racemase